MFWSLFLNKIFFLQIQCQLKYLIWSSPVKIWLYFTHQFDRNFEDFVNYYYRIDIFKICPSGGFLHSAVNSGSKDVFSKHGFSNWKLHKLGSNWKLKKHARHNRFNHFWSSIFIFHLIFLFFEHQAEAIWYEKLVTFSGDNCPSHCLKRSLTLWTSCLFLVDFRGNFFFLTNLGLIFEAIFGLELIWLIFETFLEQFLRQQTIFHLIWRFMHLSTQLQWALGLN